MKMTLAVGRETEISSDREGFLCVQDNRVGIGSWYSVSSF